MIDYLIVIPIIAAFLVVFLFMPYWMRKAKQIGLVWPDMNKNYKTEVAGSGGIVTVLGFIIGSLLYIAYRVFFLKTTDHLVEIVTLLLVMLMLSGIGLVDDLLGWKRGGLSRRSRLVLVAISAIPLMAINAGKSLINIPLLGSIDVGILYPLIILPIGIVGATTTFNFLAGFNGLEAGQGILLLAGSAIVAIATGNSWLALIALLMIAALLAFLKFNRCPAKVFPGDSITYPIGGLVAMLAIYGNFEKVAVFFFIPYIIETILKSREKLVKQSFGKPMKDGSLDLLYNKIYGLEHFAIYFLKSINVKPTEKKVVALIWTFQILIIVLGLILFRKGIFG